MIRRGLTLLNFSKKNFGGFTIVELIIVITIMGILLGLGVANFNSTQITSRDTQRKTDIETLSQYLEVFYNSGTDIATAAYDYPSTLLTTSASTMTTYLRDADITVLEAPGISDPTQTLKAATNAVQTVGGVLPQPTISQYVYQPLQTTDGGATWTLCDDNPTPEECRKYNLYYRTEADNVVHMVTSEHQ